jgi:hypothetical protein
MNLNYTLNCNSKAPSHLALQRLFTLTIGVEKATLLTNFFPFPMTAPQTTINVEGKLEFQFAGERSIFPIAIAVTKTSMSVELNFV